MSHDRGCPCGREKYEYADCDRALCQNQARAVGDRRALPNSPFTLLNELTTDQLNRVSARLRVVIEEETRPVVPTTPAVDINSIRQQLEVHAKAIGDHRDALRKLLDDYEAVAESTDQGLELLETALNYLSEHA